GPAPFGLRLRRPPERDRVRRAAARGGRRRDSRAGRGGGAACARPRRRGAQVKPPESFVRRTVRPLAAYGPPRDPAAVPLHLNESPTDLPQDLKAALADRIARSDWSKYRIGDGARIPTELAAPYGVDPAGAPVGTRA